MLLITGIRNKIIVSPPNGERRRSASHTTGLNQAIRPLPRTDDCEQRWRVLARCLLTELADLL